MWPLLGCSVVAIAILLERLLFWAVLVSRRDMRVLNEALQLLHKGQIKEAREQLSGSTDFVGKLVAKSLDAGADGFQSVVDAGTSKLLKQMRKNHRLLDTIIAVAPLLGILGTVIGIILSFKVLGQSGVQDPKAVTAGISQALITTAAGLSIAIVALLGYNFLNATVERAEQELEQALSAVELSHIKAGGA